MSKKILLTGATGFVGRQILNNLLDKNVILKVIIRGDKDIFLQDKKNLNIEVINTKDLFKEDAEWWTEQCRDVDTIIHTAWYVEPGKYLNSEKNLDCLMGSLQLIKGAINAEIKRFVGIGTCFEYDLNNGDLSINTPLKPIGPNNDKLLVPFCRVAAQDEVSFHLSKKTDETLITSQVHFLSICQSQFHYLLLLNMVILSHQLMFPS